MPPQPAATASASAKKQKKPIFKTSAPFTETQWPAITPDDQAVILDLVCNLLQPLGDHRRTHIHPSKGRKRKRKTQPLASTTPQDPANTDTLMEDDAPPPPPPPSPPEIAKHVLVGLNAVARHLEALAAKTAPSTLQQFANDNEENETLTANAGTRQPLSIVLLTHPNPRSSPAHAHLPTLIHLATLSPSSISSSSPTRPSSASTPTRLISLSTSSEPRLSSALHIPRIGALGILSSAPGAQALEDYVREKVGLTECKWLDEAVRAEWKGVGIDVKTSKTGEK